MHTTESKNTTMSPMAVKAEVKLKTFYLSSALNQSNVENMLPFGMKRQLKPLQFQNGAKPKLPIYPDDWSSLKPDDYNLKLKIGANKIKFINQKMTSSSPLTESTDCENCLKFDPSAMLFFKGNEILKTNLTSNAGGTVSNNKNYLSGVLNNQGCWLISLLDIFKFDLPEIQNNKLRAMKYLEFVTQEWDGGIDDSFGDEVEFMAVNVEESDRFSRFKAMKAWILISKKAQVIKEMTVKITRQSGATKIEIDTRDLPTSFASITRIPVSIEDGDTIILAKAGSANKMNLAPFKLEDDLESKISCHEAGVKALIVSRVHYKYEFDELFNGRTDFKCEYVCHLDTKVGDIVNGPKPIPFGCTTRHSVIYRKGYFAALHHDASKINRFSDTINYIIRKLINPENLTKRLEQEGIGSSSSGGGGGGHSCAILKRISDIQYFAYLIKSPKELGYFLGLGGGAKCVLMSIDLKKIKIFELPILIFIPSEEFKSFPNLILLSPHFPSVLIKSVGNYFSVVEWMKSLLMLSGLNSQNFKVSMAYFIIN